jgi:hypothetical protein
MKATLCDICDERTGPDVQKGGTLKMSPFAPYSDEMSQKGTMDFCFVHYNEMKSAVRLKLAELRRASQLTKEREVSSVGDHND